MLGAALLSGPPRHRYNGSFGHSHWLATWDEFLDAYPVYDFYKGNEELVRDAIERTHDIVWNEFEDTWVDTSAKLPTISVPGKTPFQHLTTLVKDALISHNLHKDKVYVERAKEELRDIEYLGHEAYFITMYEIFKKAEQKTNDTNQMPKTKTSGK